MPEISSELIVVTKWFDSEDDERTLTNLDALATAGLLPGETVCLPGVKAFLPRIVDYVDAWRRLDALAQEGTSTHAKVWLAFLLTLVPLGDPTKYFLGDESTAEELYAFALVHVHRGERDLAVDSLARSLELRRFPANLMLGHELGLISGEEAEREVRRTILSATAEDFPVGATPAEEYKNKWRELITGEYQTRPQWEMVVNHLRRTSRGD